MPVAMLLAVLADSSHDGATKELDLSDRCIVGEVLADARWPSGWIAPVADRTLVTLLLGKKFDFHFEFSLRICRAVDSFELEPLVAEWFLENLVDWLDHLPYELLCLGNAQVVQH